MNIQPITSGPGQALFLEVALPEQASHHGTLHGPDALRMMGKAAFVCAARHAGCPVLMVKADNVEFARAIRIGSTVKVRAKVVFQGRSSMTVVVEIVPDNPDDDPAPAITGRFMMVAVDGDGRPVPIPVSDQHVAEDLHP